MSDIVGTLRNTYFFGLKDPDIVPTHAKRTIKSVNSKKMTLVQGSVKPDTAKSTIFLAKEAVAKGLKARLLLLAVISAKEVVAKGRIPPR